MNDGTSGMLRILGRDERVDLRPGPNTEIPPVMMLMGLGGNLEMWEPFRTALMAGFLPHARLEIVRRGGHLLLFERTPEALDVVAPFLMEDLGHTQGT